MKMFPHTKKTFCPKQYLEIKYQSDEGREFYNYIKIMGQKLK